MAYTYKRMASPPTERTHCGAALNHVSINSLVSTMASDRMVAAGAVWKALGNILNQEKIRLGQRTYFEMVLTVVC